VNTVNTSLSGTLVDIRTSCPEDYTFTWSSQPRVGKAPAGNLLLAAAIVFSGSAFTTFSNIASLLNLSLFSERLFNNIHATDPYIPHSYLMLQAKLKKLLQNC
jgi:hypothetical protein